MTDYGFLIDWDNNGYHAWDARPGDAPNLLGRGAANWTADNGARVHSCYYDYRFASTRTYNRTSDTQAAATGDAKDAGLLRLRWRTGTDSPYPNGFADSLFLYSDQYFDQLYGSYQRSYNLLLPAGTYHFKVRVMCATGTVTGMTLYVRTTAGVSLASTALGTINASTYTSVSVTFTVPSEQSIYFQITKSGVLNFTLYLIEPFLISGAGTHPAFNCGTPSLSENLTSDVMEARWNVGFKEPWKHVGNESRLQLTLTNAGETTYSLENPSSPLHRTHRLGPMQIRVVANANSAGWQTLYTGYIESIQPQAMLNGRKTARLVAGTVRRLLDKQELEMALYENIDSPDLLAVLMDFAELTQVAPYLTQPQLVRMGEAFSATGTQYRLAGDQWPAGTRVLDAVADVLEADFGKLWINRDGDAEYYLLLDYDSILALSMDTLNDTHISGAEYEVIAARANVVHAYSYPRKVTGANFVLWQLDDTLSIDAESEEDIAVRFTMADDELQVGGKDTSVTTFTAGAGVSYVWAADDARGGTLTITNTATSARNVTAIVIEGKRITWFNPIRQKAKDTDAIAKFGKVTEVIENKLISKKEIARAHAQYLVGEFGEPRGVLKNIRLFAKTEAQRAQYLGYRPGTFIQVSEGQTFHDSRYLVIGEEHDLRDGLKNHSIRLHLEQFQRWFVLDDLEAGLLDAGFYLG